MNSFSSFQSANTCFVRKHWKVSLKTNLMFCSKKVKSQAKLEEMPNQENGKFLFSVPQLNKVWSYVKSISFWNLTHQMTSKNFDAQRPLRRTSKKQQERGFFEKKVLFIQDRRFLFFLKNFFKKWGFEQSFLEKIKTSVLYINLK